MKPLELAVLLLPLLIQPTAAQAKPTDIQCPGQNTIEMRWCASQKLDESSRALQKKLSPEAFNTWKRTTQKVCAAAYAPVRQGTIYPQMVLGCDDRLNRSLIEEFQHFGE